ncbi:hypothetical protein [Pseudomonas sp. EMN2]|uniref:hypothetical protein n=1 Tax=Pseudomonas sp. EMN2 TaxID=2615212 RepID=UPI00129A4262|nr:hypothetical protein [Pseudomonas sp. EMN2]
MSFDTQRKSALLQKQDRATTQPPRVEGQSIAQSVLEYFQATGFVAVPDGEFAAAVSHPKSSDPADPRRSLYLIFSDGSDIGLHGSEVGGASQAGEADADRRCEAALKIAPELGQNLALNELSHRQEVRWTSLLGLIEVSDGKAAVVDAGGRAEGYALGLFDAGVITEALRERLARTASKATAAKVDRLEREETK